MITLEQVREQFIQAIKNSDLTQVELGRRLHISQSVISDYLNGKKMPALDTLANLCVILDLDANDILCVR